MSNHPAPRLAVVVFGMRCAFSGPPLAALLDAGIEVRAVVLPGPPFGPPVIRHRPPEAAPRLAAPGASGPAAIDEQAQARGIPVLSIRSPREPEVLENLRGLAPDAIVVACFPQRLPRAMLDLPRFGCINIHPSLLPRGRGPDPIFWTFRRGETETGTTVHLMAERFDAGPILRQQAIPVPDGVGADALERDLAGLGGRLAVAALADLAAGTARPVPQDETQATLAPLPSDDDFLMPTDRPAAWAYRFARGVAPLDGPLAVAVCATGEQIAVETALAWDRRGRLGQPYRRDGDRLAVQFHPGTVVFLSRG